MVLVWMVEFDLIFVFGQNEVVLVWRSVHPFFVGVIEIDVFFAWVVGSDLSFVCGLEMTCFLCGERN